MEDMSRAVKSLKLERYNFSNPGRTESREGEIPVWIRAFHFPCFIHSGSWPIGWCSTQPAWTFPPQLHLSEDTTEKCLRIILNPEKLVI